MLVQVLLQQQQYVKAEELLDKLAPGLLQEQHSALFELKHCQFTSVGAAGQRQHGAAAVQPVLQTWAMQCYVPAWCTRS